MVKRIAFSLILLAFFLIGPGIAVNASSGWRLVFPSYPPVGSDLPPEIFDLENGKFFVATKHGGFLTKDNGKSWHFIDMKLGDNRDQRIRAFFLDSEKGWAWNRQEIAFSSDGGSSWKIISNSPWARKQSRDITRIFFLDEKTGFIFSPWDMARTFDGGRQWSKSPSLPSMGTSNSRCWFISPNEGFIIAKNVLYKTENAGADWGIVFTGEETVVNAFFYNENGLVIDRFGDTYSTNDSGKTWHEGELPDYSLPASFKFNDRGHGMGLGSRCFLYRTYDWGRNWITKDLQSVFKDCEPLTNEYAKNTHKKILWDGESIDRVAIRWLKGIFETTDGGTTWKQHDIPAENLWVDDNHRIIARNFLNQIFYSIDYGKSWTRILNETKRTYDVSINDGRNWSLGKLITTDAGETWKRSPFICARTRLNFDYHYLGKDMQLSKLTDALRNTCNDDLASYHIKGLYLFPNKTTYVDNYGIVYSWDYRENKFKAVGNILDWRHKNERIKELGPIYFGSGDCGCAFGMKRDTEGGIVENGLFYTHDGGRSWRKSKVEKADQEGVELPVLSEEGIKEEDKPIINRVLGIAKKMKGIVKAGFYLEDCGDGWGIVMTYAKNWYLIKTTDGGKNWSIISNLNHIDLYPTRDPLSLAFLDKQTGWISDGGNLYKTTDAGISWTNVILPVKAIEIKKIVVDKGEVFLNARGFVLMRTHN